jgi:hypothetical protein
MTYYISITNTIEVTIYIRKKKDRPPLKVLLLGQIDPIDLDGLHLPLQHLCGKMNYICMSK